MPHILNSCPLTKFDGGLLRLQEADEAAVDWLTTYVTTSVRRRHPSVQFMSSSCRRCAVREDLRLHQRHRELDEVESAPVESGQNRGHVVHNKSAQTPATIHRHIDCGCSSHPGAVRS